MNREQELRLAARAWWKAHRPLAWTALPATRASAMQIVNSARMSSAPYGAVEISTGLNKRDWEALLALAEKGAETVGATEAWLFAPPIERGNDTRQIMAGCVHPTKEMGEEDWEGETDRPIVRRCLILPDESQP